MTRTGRVVVGVGLVVLSLFAQTPARGCPGDCDENTRVTIDELLRALDGSDLGSE